MLYRTHIISSVAAAAAFVPFNGTAATVIGISGVAIGSLLPDIDEPNSYVGRRTKGVSHMTKAIFGHRGFTHTLLATLLVFIPFILLMYPHLLGDGFEHYMAQSTKLTTFFLPLFYGIGIGYLFHILGDMLSISGVPLFMPFTQKKFKIPLYRTGGKREMLIRYACFLYLAHIVIVNT